MLPVALLIQGCSLLGAALVAAQDDAPELEPEFDFHPTRYIVEFSDIGSKKFRKRDGTPDTDEFIVSLQEAGTVVEPAYSFTSELFHGASFDLVNATAEEILAIQDLPEVESIWPVPYITLDIEPEAVFDASTNLTQWTPHEYTNVSLVHEMGYRGEDVVVAVVDTGIDYNHPALGGGFGPGFRVESGWDFNNDSPDPMDCHGHGTHVSGIVGADDPSIQGVAPKVRLRAYKVFDCGGSTTADIAMLGFIRAYEEGADVINGSLGSVSGFPYNPFSLLLSRIQAQGVMVVIAAGNSGRIQGAFYTSDLGNNFGGLTVGSVEHSSFPGYEFTAHSTNGESRTFVYIGSDAEPYNVTGNLTAAWVNGDTRTFPSCFIANEMPIVPDDQLLILPRVGGDCSWQALDNRLNNRVTWAFWYNFEGAEFEIPSRYLYDPEVQAKGSGLISYEAGDWLVTQHENNHNVTFVFDAAQPAVAIPRPSLEGGRLSTFSSWGPTIDARMKPEVSAPGGSILNAYLDGTWVLLSGTSMSSPYVAGLAALVLQAHGTRATRDDAAAYARSRIITSARPVKIPRGSDDSLASIAQQGAGLVDAVKAVGYSTFANPPYINLNDTDHFAPTHQIEITNGGEEPVTYSLSHRFEPTFFTRSAENGQLVLQPEFSSEAGDVAEVELSTTELVVGPGETGTFEVTFTEPATADVVRFPVYGGAIAISGENGENIRVVYMGIKGSINEFPHWAGDSRAFSDENDQELVDGRNYTFNVANQVPYAPFMIVWSVVEASIEFVDRYWSPDNFTYPPVPGENNFYGYMRTVPTYPWFVDTGFPIYNYPRASTQYFARPSATFVHGEEIADGEYRMLKRSLKTYGDKNNIDDWQLVLSPWFRVERGLEARSEQQRRA